MVDISIGDITARLTLNATDFQRGLQDAIRTLQQFAQTKDQILQNMQRLQNQGQGVSQSFQQFNTQLNQTNQQFNQTNNTLNQTNQQFNQFNQTINNVTNNTNQGAQGARNFGNAWSTVLQIAAGVGLATTVQGLIQGFIHLATTAVQTAAHMQDVHRAFTALTGSGALANQVMVQLFDVAQRSGVSFTAMVEGFRRLQSGAQGTVLTLQDMLQGMENFARGARTLGLSAQQQESALVAFEQMLTKGRVQAEELVRQLANAVPGGLGITARALGVTTAQLREMAESGLLPATVAWTAFQNGMRQAAESTSGIRTLTETFTALKNETVAWLTAIGESIGKTLQPWLDKITEISKALRDLLGIRAPGEQPGLTGPPTAATRFPLAESPYTALFRQEGQRSAVDPGLLSQIARVESGFKPGVTSPAGATGLMQLMLPTAQAYEMGVTAETLKEPERNIRIAAKHLADLLDAYRSYQDQVSLALAAYNAGQPKVDALLKAARLAGTPTTFAGIAPQLPAETQAYVPKVLAQLPAPGTTAGPAGAAPDTQTTAAIGKIWNEEITKAVTQFEQLRKQVDALQQGGTNFNNILGKDVAQQADRLLQSLTAIQGVFARFPDYAKQVDAGTKEWITSTLRQAAIWRESLNTPERFRDLLKQQVEQLEQVEIRQRAALVQQRQGQEEAERYTRQATAALQERRIREPEAMAGLTIEQQIAEYQRRIAALRNEVSKLGAEIEAQRVKALTPGLSAELTRVETFLGRATEDRAVQARENVLAQGEAMRKTLDEIGRVVAQHPALQEIQERLQNILRTFEEDLVAVAERAYNEARVLQRAPEFQAGVARSAQYFEQQRDALRALREENEQLLEPRQQGFPVYTRTVEQEIDRRNRLQEARTGQGLFTDEEGRRNARQLLEQQRALERTVYYADLFAQLGSSVGNAWTQALTGIADGTKTVSEAFRAMAQSILQSLIQITSQEAWRAVVQLGIRLILGAATSSVGAGAGAGGGVGGDYSLNIAGASGGLYGGSGLQTGGIVTRPSFHMLAEGGRPEAVVPLDRMREFAQSVGPSAGGQAMGGISIINVPDAAAAEREKAKQESLGRTAVINYVMADLGQGEGSRINRAIRSLQR